MFFMTFMVKKITFHYSINKIGRWPWPRSVIAEGIRATNEAQAKVIGLNILFTEPEKNQELNEIRKLNNSLSTILKGVKKSRNTNTRKIENTFSKKIRTLLSSELTEIEKRMDNDSHLSNILAESNNVILPMFFNIGPALGEEEPVLWEQTLADIENPDDLEFYYITEGYGPVIPLGIFSDNSAGVGHVNILPEVDGVVRSDIPLIQFQGDFYFSFAVQVVRQYLNIPIESIVLRAGDALLAGEKARIPMDDKGRMLINYNGPIGTFSYYSFYDVIQRKIDPAAFKNKIVLIGHTATGIADLNVTPLGNNFPGIEITANVIQNILQQSFITRPEWAKKAELAGIIIIGLFVSILLPRLKAFLGSLISVLLVIGTIVFGMYMFVAYGYWIKIFYASFLLMSGYIVITSKRFFVTEKRKELVEASAIETNRMLGLSFQGQGMLDMAFEKLRKCPIDDNMKELLYNLALDFERKS